MEPAKFSWKARVKSFTYAWAGLKALLSTEHNAYVHLALTIAALFLGMAFRISAVEWLFLVFAIALVWITELVNTALEKAADLISKEYHPQIKIVKDVAAAAVLVAAVAALLTGCIIFLPKVFDMVSTT
jgi:diacylglycerol kinase